MSWLQDLAGKAENILTKIDQNAATVLTRQSAEENGDVEPLLEVTTTVPAGETPLASVKLPAPKALSLNTEGGGSVKSERQASSRRSSISSKRDGTVIEFNANPVVVSGSQDSGYSLEKELAATKIILAEVKSERDELKIELDSAQNQLNNAEQENKVKELEALCQALIDEKNELYVKQTSTQESNAKYIKSISELESIVSKHIQNEQELQQKLEIAKTETQNVTTELQQYRVRAHATLQLKEKMIEQLKENVIPNAMNKNPNANSEQIMLIELEQLKNERQNLIDEISALSGKFERSKLQWQTTEDRFNGTVRELEGKVEELQQRLNVETTKLHQLDDDLGIKQKELLSAREELVKQRTAFSVKVHEKESEITKLRNKMHNRPTSPSSDLELRLSSLTQSLVQKQNTLESITAERNALRLQLEKLDTQYRGVVSQVRQQRAPFMSSNETDDAKSQVPNFMVENPFDNKMARRVKRAYSSLDSIGIRLGVFLRRYPLIRILVIFYVALLHMWVMFVLLSSTPA
ncbi:AAEL002097-PB [Aedes aegypti]|uniref:AAEL002097-PA n=1 Tax=Aedes aegypti TaxID=7159 RepID=Q17J85_AEDAE|nr:AAEL002097-PA [Aedes aegypti]EAT46722.1 AAEL002097-PB [Aedes aegypti]